MSLVQVQTDFAAMLMSPDAKCLSDGEVIYHNAYRRRLLEALTEVYDKTWSWLGDHNFEQAAFAHINQCHSQSWTLNAYGVGFCETLRDLYPDDYEVAELAKLEWALHVAFAAKDSGKIDPSKLQQIDWSLARIEFVPALQFLEVRTNAPALWAALSRSETPPQPEHLSEPLIIMVWRKGYEPHFRTIDLPQATAINHLQSGISFADVCDALSTSPDLDVTALAASWLGSWFNDHIISEITEI